MPQETKEILIIELFGLGDLIYTGSFVKTIRENNPDINILMIINSENKSFPYIEELGIRIYHFESWKSKAKAKRPFKFLKSILKFRNKYGFRFKDCLGFDPRGDHLHWLVLHSLGVRKVFSSNLDNHLSLLKKRQAYHFRYNCNIFEARQRFLRKIAPEIGISGDTSLVWPWLRPYKVDKFSSDPLSFKNIVLAPEAGRPLRYWESAKWATLAQKLLEEGWYIILIVHQDNAIDKRKQHLFDCIWRGSIADMRQLLLKTRAVISTDSFIGHIAAACGVPVISLFGPQLPNIWQPWGEYNRIAFVDGYQCRPCDQINCVRPNENCMQLLSVETVFDAFQQMVDVSGKPFV